MVGDSGEPPKETFPQWDGDKMMMTSPTHNDDITLSLAHPSSRVTRGENTQSMTSQPP